MMKILLVDKTNLTLQGQTVRDHDLTTKQTHSQLFLKLFLTLSLWTRSFFRRARLELVGDIEGEAHA